jgi:Zn-dependent peptidase ImmA (M78 family)/transcriptional regulator with XRE-family HTH domain
MESREFASWQEVGEQVAAARHAFGMTQDELAVAVGLDRTAITKIESGVRGLSSLELARLARELKRPLDWFVTSPPPAVISRRHDARLRGDESESTADALIEVAARDVELLVELEVLDVPSLERPDFAVNDLESAERAAGLARNFLGQTDGPLIALGTLVESFGLFAFSADLPEGLNGSYVSLGEGGVALVNGNDRSGRRRFTLAHELGHYYLDDEYSTDWHVATSHREGVLDAFAVHLLMPRASIVRRWEELQGAEHPRQALMRIGVEYRVSWTAVTAQATNLGLIDTQRREHLNRATPSRAELVEQRLIIAEELHAPWVSPAFAAAVIKAYRRYLLTADRAVELLRGTFTLDELPEQTAVRMDELRHDMSALAE